MDYYVARWYDPVLGHFTQADTLIPEPGEASAFDRYAYVQNSPVKYNDPSGHDVGCAGTDASNCRKKNNVIDRSLGYRTKSSSYLNIWDNKNSRTSEAGRKFIKSWEFKSTRPYNDNEENPDAGNCTVGWGHKLHPNSCTNVEVATEYSQEDIENLFEDDLLHKEIAVRQAFQILDNQYRPNPPYTEGNPVPINQYQFDALVDFAFNAGEGSVQYLIWESVKVEAGTENGNFIKEALESNMSVYTDPNQPGLKIRREQELLLFYLGNYSYSH